MIDFHECVGVRLGLLSLFFGTDFTDYTVFCLEEITGARSVRDVG